jgi:hypothetical protein
MAESEWKMPASLVSCQQEQAQILSNLVASSETRSIRSLTPGINIAGGDLNPSHTDICQKVSESTDQPLQQDVPPQYLGGAHATFHQ